MGYPISLMMYLAMMKTIFYRRAFGKGNLFQQDNPAVSVIVQLMKTEVTLQLAPSGRLRGAETERVHHTAQPHAPP
jgi:hypothetical protein